MTTLLNFQPLVKQIVAESKFDRNLFIETYNALGFTLVSETKVYTNWVSKLLFRPHYSLKFTKDVVYDFNTVCKALQSSQPYHHQLGEFALYIEKNRKNYPLYQYLYLRELYQEVYVNIGTRIYINQLLR